MDAQRESFTHDALRRELNEELFLQTWKGFLRQIAKGKTKVPMIGFWSRFGGLVEKVLSPASITTYTGMNLILGDKGLTAQVNKTMEAPCQS